jgi:hypothetical protein
MLETEERAGYACLGLARVVEVQADRRVILDERFIPPCLRVSPQRHPLPSTHIPFLDILLVFGRRASPNPASQPSPTVHVTTRLYDKRDQPAFASLRLSRFVPPFSNVAACFKRNILSGQFARLSRDSHRKILRGMELLPIACICKLLYLCC